MVLIRNMRTVDLDFFVNVVIVRNVTSLFHDLKRYYERLEKFECWSQQLRSEKVRQNAENVGRVNEQPGRRRRQNNSAGNAPALTLFIGRPNVAGENLAGRGVPWTAYQSLRRCL